MAKCRLRRHGLKYFSASPQRGDMRDIISALRILYHGTATFASYKYYHFHLLFLLCQKVICHRLRPFGLFCTDLPKSEYAKNHLPDPWLVDGKLAAQDICHSDKNINFGASCQKSAEIKRFQHFFRCFVLK